MQQYIPVKQGEEVDSLEEGKRLLLQQRKDLAGKRAITRILKPAGYLETTGRSNS